MLLTDCVISSSRYSISCSSSTLLGIVPLKGVVLLEGVVSLEDVVVSLEGIVTVVSLEAGCSS